MTTIADPVDTQVAVIPATPRILIVDDEVLLARAIAKRLAKAGYDCTVCPALAEARAALAATPPSLILLDARLPDGNGMEFLGSLEPAGDGKPPAVIVLTAYGEIDDAVTAMKLGAADYLKKPVDLDELLLVIERVLQSVDLRHRLDFSRARETRAVDGVDLLGDSPAARRSRDQIAAIAAIRSAGEAPLPTVLILGETGTGKDVAARLLHRLGDAADRPFVHVDCASLPRELIEAELFGHVRGAFTSAGQARPGLIEAAEDGTVFLDEIGELPLDLQAKLLTAIERRRTRRIGSVQELPVRARFIAATNRPLAELVAKGQFRDDLYYRLNVLALTMPPLRDCGDDAVLLAREFAAQTARRYGRPVPRLAASAETAIRRYSWPGNVRELKHLVERGVLLNAGEITAAALGLDAASDAAPAAGGDAMTLAGMTLDGAERALIVAALERTGGNVSEAARQLGVTRMALRYRMEKHNLSVRPG